MNLRKRVFSLLLTVCILLCCGCTVPTGTDPTEDSTTDPITESSEAVFSPGTSGSSVIELPDEETVVSVVACGDNLIHPSIYYYAMECAAKKNGENCTYAATNDANYDFLPIYENVAPLMKNADLCYINQETLSGGEGTKIDGYPKFNSPEAVGMTLKELGVDVVNMAHNHMLDAHNDSFLIHSDGFFRSLGMTPIGYYENEAATDDIVLVESKGVTFAFLPYTYSTNGIVCYSQTYIPYFKDELIRKQVALAKQQADVVVVSAHWGDEYAFQPNCTQKYYANLFCELGVDVVLGMHSHCIEPMQWMESSTGHRMLLTYSLGNFISGMHEAQTALEGILTFQVRKNHLTGQITVEEPLFHPIVAHYTYVKSVSSNDSGYRNFKIYELKDYTQELASQHGIKLHYEGDWKKPTTLYGGGFSLENLYTTLHRIIPDEFLEEVYRK